MPFQLLDIHSASERVHIPENELHHLVQRGELNCTMRGEKIFFEQSELDKWDQQRILALNKKEVKKEYKEVLKDQRKWLGHIVRINTFLKPNLIFDDIQAKTHAGVLRSITDLLDKTGYVTDSQLLFKGLLEREESGPTAIEGGVAFLHTQKHDSYLFTEDILALARVSKPIFFKSLDGQPTDLFFLVGTTEPRLHLQVLSCLCTLALHTNLINNLRAAVDADELFQAFKGAEEAFLAVESGQ